MKRILSILFALCLMAGMLGGAPVKATAMGEEPIQVQLGEIPIYNGRDTYHNIPVTVTAGDMVLKEGQDYTLTYKNNQHLTDQASVTVIGKGFYAGYEQTFTYPIVSRHISDTDITVGGAYFVEGKLQPRITITCNGNTLSPTGDYEVICENDFKSGTGKVCIIGVGGFYGYTVLPYQFLGRNDEVTLKGKYLGTVDGTLSEDYAYSERTILPGTFTAKVNCSTLHVAAYALYRVEGPNAVLITQYTSEDSTSNEETAFSHDFSSGYEGEEENSGDMYVLSYSWVDYRGKVYGGAELLTLASEPKPATSMYIMRRTELSTFNRHCLEVVGRDGDLCETDWSSSDPSIATVEMGVVTFKKPGTVTITARSGDFTETTELTGAKRALYNSLLYDYSEEKGVRVIYYNYYLLKEGSDYTVSVEQTDGQNVVTVDGCGLYWGQLVRRFDAESGEPVEHTHFYRDPCEPLCYDCKQNRTVAHGYSNDWSKNTTHHWHECSACGDQTDKAEHTLASGDSITCTVCGKLYLPGDFDGDWLVTESDVIWLLWHTVDPASYSLVSSGDYDGDGTITEADVIHLLWHTVDPDNYPLN